MVSKNNKKSEQTPKPSKPAHKTRKQEQDPEAKAPAEPTNRPRGLTVVGIGASAGGLAALQSFFGALPSDTGMAFVVVTHLHPEHESHMAELLQKHTEMPAKQVSERVKVEPNSVYVIPPNRSISMVDSHLDIAEFTEPHGRRTPVDHFFRSLASGHSESIAVILSGGGTDGSVGAKDIKERGGLILVQDPEDAEYDSMPRAAINTGLADVVLPAAQLATKLAEYVLHLPQLPHDAGQLSEAELETLQRILAQVHARTGHDFIQYKRSTILRRVERRMQLNGFSTLEAYLDYLRRNASEAQAMFNDILIGVTNFFRDRESWEALEAKTIPALFKQKDNGNEIRIWTIGCATGEEAYSLAILLFEQAANLDFRPHMQVFASDLDEGSIRHAREGLYPAAIEADVSAERLERFFTREGEYYRVKRELRDIVLFTNHNALRDPPFSRQDLIACRNVLIYLQRGIQDRVFDIFHYALNPDGYLFLGSSESAEHIPDLFSVVDKTHRIYQAKPWFGEKPHVPSMPLGVRVGRRPGEPYRATRPAPGGYVEESPVAEELHRRALEAYAPPSIIVNQRNDILHVSETAGRYLLQPKGPITGDLLRLVRPELQMELRAALFRAFEGGQSMMTRPVSVQFNGHAPRVIVSVRPQTVATGDGQPVEREALVLFLEDESPAQEQSIEKADYHGDAEREKVVGELQAEVQRLREQLQITDEEYDTSNEEMKAANEELQSINEEYRSATEELETSKEELQSLNEELQTVNTEMKSKLDEITRAHQELENLMGATEIATLYLDRELRIQRFTAGVKELFNIRASDRGRRISDQTNKLKDFFMNDAEAVMRRLVPIEHEVQVDADQWILMRMRPYRTVDDKIEGVVISFIDITKLKETQRELVQTKESLEQHVKDRTRQLDEANQNLSHARDLFHALFHANPIPTSLTRLEDGLFMDVNDAYLEYYGLEYDHVIGRTSAELHLPHAPRVRPGLVARLEKEGMIRNLEMGIEHPSGETRNILAAIQRINLDGIDAMISTFSDITERVRSEQQVRDVASSLTASEQVERHRISRILHDDLQQNIFAVKMQLTFLAEAVEKNDLTGLKLDLQQLDEWLAEAIATTRQLSIDLSPPVLRGEGLTEALIWLASQMKEQYNLEVNVHTNGVHAAFEDDIRVLIFQSIRELLFNVVKHSGGLKARLTFEQVSDKAYIIVSDGGLGFDSQTMIEDSKAGHGLLRMRDRLMLLGCNLEVKSEPNNGTHITIEAPVKNVID